MTVINPKQYYSRFLAGHQNVLHFAAHSHHFWPDVSREAQLAYWDDSALLSDDKWNKVFQEVLPKTQQHIAKILNLKNPQQIVIAPNTHELTSRLLSLFLGRGPLNILTTSSEFYSWSRQIKRLSELPQVNVKEISTESLWNNRREFINRIKDGLNQHPNICFLSQVFFDSGWALSTEEILEISQTAHPSTILVIDGYHAFAAVPTDLSQLEGKIFYLGGGYKYAQAGEGVGFMVVPQGSWRPAYTGWFAEFGVLTQSSQQLVGYASDATAFMGATQDPSGMYRMNAVWDLFDGKGINVSHIHDYIQSLQRYFIQKLPANFLHKFALTPLFRPDLLNQGHFLTFKTSRAKDLTQRLSDHGIKVDCRSDRLRFGFGLYQEVQDVSELCLRLGNL